VRLYRHILFPGILGGLLCITSCYQEVFIPDEIDEVFNLTVSSGVQEFLYESRDTTYTVDDPGIEMYLNDISMPLKEIRVRGKTSLNFKRKSFSVFLDAPVTVTDREGLGVKSLLRFKLLAMAMDYTYIENRIGYGLQEEAGVMPLFYKYVELRINDDTQGVYMLVEDPEQFFIEQGSEYILRRGYHHGIWDSEYEPGYHFIARETYETRFREIYSKLTSYQGGELYSWINARMDLAQYFRKMGVDYLLKNGDYTDEVFFYATMDNQSIRYRVIPWDYDDLFKNDPHEVGRNWGTGTLFGERVYATLDDIYAEIGDKMIFSIEDDLDYIIAMDPVLYTRYEEELRKLLDKLNEATIDRLFNRINHELSVFYNHSEIIGQSEFDQERSSLELWENNMEQKKELLKERLGQMKQQLNTPSQ